jgi:hypothetical protein
MGDFFETMDIVSGWPTPRRNPIMDIKIASGRAEVANRVTKRKVAERLML